MCGLAGFIHPEGLPYPEANRLLNNQTDAIAHRGPDSSGVWIDQELGIGLGHRRLSIVDLSPQGHQPMLSACGRYVLVFNGEIYNHLHIRSILSGTYTSIHWRGTSDTETLLVALSHWGLAKTFQKITGMFSFVLWDRKSRTLHLARDRFGEKPLYYGFQQHTFLFGSELKSIRVHPAFENVIDRSALALYFRHNCVPSPFSIYHGIYKLPPGTFLSIGWDHLTSATLPEPTPYWSTITEAANATSARNSFTPSLENLDSLLRQVISDQLISDVPLGAFLSGGIDSSLIVSIMAQLSSTPVKTFTIGFNESTYNEATYAKDIARHLCTDHCELYVSPNDALAIIPTLSNVYDEPFADSSQIPTILLSKLASQHVKVCLTGDGGDELFGGYNRYTWTDSFCKNTFWLGRRSRSLISRLIRTTNPGLLNRQFDTISAALPSKLRFRNFGDKLHKLTDVLDSVSPNDAYYKLVSHWKHPSDLVIGSLEPTTLLSDLSNWPQLLTFTEQMMALDTVTYLPDDILVKVDRAAMSTSLETRVPFLDPRIFHYAWNMELTTKISGNNGKQPLRALLSTYLPPSLYERPKMGFGIPIDQWLRGPLRDWASDLLDPDYLSTDNILDPAMVTALWNEHLSGTRNWQYLLWDVLMWQSWRMNTN